MSRSGIATSLNALGGVAFEEGHYSAANALNKESLAIRHALGERRTIAYSLVGVAEVVAALGSILSAARIWGAAERLREEIGSPLAPNERPAYDQRVGAARAALGNDAAFDPAWQEGRALSLDEAIALAMAKTGELG